MKIASATRDGFFAIIFSLILVSTQVFLSLDSGSLSFPPTYDAIGYYLDALQRTRSVESGTFFQNLLANPPHAPGSTVLAFIGFSLFGIRAWSPVLMNFIPLALFAFVILRLQRKAPFPAAMMTTAGLLLIPFWSIAIDEFRPDMWCGAFIVSGVACVVFRHAEDRTWLVGGLAFGAALLMKPTFAPMICILFGMAVFLRFVPLLGGAQGWVKMAKAGAIVLGVACLIAGTHYALAWRSIVNYYAVHVFGAGAASWTPNLGLKETILYYLSGPGGRPFLGVWLWLAPIVALAPIGFVVAGRRDLAWKSCAYLIVSIIAYFIVTLPGNKSPFLGVGFVSFIVGALVIVAIASGNAVRSNRRYSYAVAVAIFGVGLFGANTAWTALHGTAYPAQVAAARTYVNQRIVGLLWADKEIHQKQVMFAQIAQYTNAETLAFLFAELGIVSPTIVSEYFTDDMTRQRAMIASSQYIITVSADYPGGLSWVPSAKIGPQINAALDADTGLELVQSFSPPGEPGEFRIYKRR